MHTMYWNVPIIKIYHTDPIFSSYFSKSVLILLPISIEPNISILSFLKYLKKLYPLDLYFESFTCLHIRGDWIIQYRPSTAISFHIAVDFKSTSTSWKNHVNTTFISSRPKNVLAIIWAKKRSYNYINK